MTEDWLKRTKEREMKEGRKEERTEKRGKLPNFSTAQTGKPHDWYFRLMKLALCLSGEKRLQNERESDLRESVWNQNLSILNVNLSNYILF